jgi:hypothetical protein
MGLDSSELKVSHAELDVCASNLANFPLVGNGEITNEYCGKFSSYYGCDQLELHAMIGRRQGKDYADKIFIHKVHFSCDKPSCPVCARYGWAIREAHKIEKRLEVASKDLGEPEHIVCSISPKDYGISDEKVLRAMAEKALADRGIIGGVLLFHGSRKRRFEHLKGGVFRQIGLDWKPHYHVLGFIQGGYKCRDCKRKSNCLKDCGGFDDRSWQQFAKGGIYVKVEPKRKTIFGTAWYQLHHASLGKKNKRSHVATWFGACSYRKLKVKVEKKKHVCRVCQYELKRFEYVGKKSFATDRDSPDYVRDSMENYYEDGVPAWHEAPKRAFVRKTVCDEPKYGSMEWLKHARNSRYGE